MSRSKKTYVAGFRQAAALAFGYTVAQKVDRFTF
jgi:hypothetical protein